MGCIGWLAREETCAGWMEWMVSRKGRAGQADPGICGDWCKSQNNSDLQTNFETRQIESRWSEAGETVGGQAGRSLDGWKRLEAVHKPIYPDECNYVANRLRNGFRG